MSSRKSAAASLRKRAVKRVAPVKAARVVPVKIPGENCISDDALRLAAAVERGLSKGEAGVLTPEAVQALMAAACKTYAVQVEAGENFLPLKPQTVAPTEVMLTASGLLRAVNLAVFELGMWQSWTGR